MNWLKNLTQLEKVGKPLAIVLGSSLPSGLGAVRNLGKQGIPVLWLDSNPKNAGFLSRYCISIPCPHPRQEEQVYIEFLQYLGQNLSDRGILIPVGDIELISILKHRRLLEKYFRFSVAPYDVTIKFLDKEIFYKTLEEENIPHPRTFFPHDISDLDYIEKKITFPCILKPNFSGYFYQDFHTKLFTARNQEEMRKRFEEAKAKHNDVTIQEFIPGQISTEYGFNAYYNHSFTPVGEFMYQRIREWPPNFGTASAIHRVIIPEFEQIITPLMKKIKYFGIVDVEFKKDDRDGLFKVIEINPRIWLQNNLPTRFGINHAFIAYLDSIEKSIDMPSPAGGDMKWLCLVNDVRSAFRHLRNGDISLREWVMSYQGKKKYAIYNWDDPLPFFGLCANYIANLLFQRR